jgi:hypothetical protein
MERQCVPCVLTQDYIIYNGWAREPRPYTLVDDDFWDGLLFFRIYNHFFGSYSINITPNTMPVSAYTCTFLRSYTYFDPIYSTFHPSYSTFDPSDRPFYPTYTAI